MDWQLLAEQAIRRLGLAAGDVRTTPVAGGDINQAYRLDIGAQRFFVKINRVELLPMFQAERAGLEAIAGSKTIRVPEVLLTGSQDASAFIVMEYIEFSGRPAAERMAPALAAMHNCYHRQFGFDCDDHIGSTPQRNRFSDDWIEFWRQHRLGYQLQLAERNGFGTELAEAGNRLAQNLHLYFSGYQPRPSLLHGDLWSGNQAADGAGNPVIFDPACYYGDHETDLAMMELFGHPGESFFAVYREHFPIDAGYRLRRELYNLYHVLNHANLFGGGYAAQARDLIDRLLAHGG